MAQIPYRANLSAATWPFLASLFGRSVIVGGPDQNFSRELYAGPDSDKDIGIPQAYYLHNAMPTAYGFTTVGYETQSSPGSSLTSISDVHLVYGEDGAKAYICKSDQGLGVFKLPGKIFTLLLPLTYPYTQSQLTVATVNGLTYFYVAYYGCYRYEPTSNSLIPVTLSGIDPTQIIGICAANGYMVAYSATQVLWSSTLTPTDFIPSLLTGAGGGAVENIKGPIVTVVPTNTGLAIFSSVNAVATIYTGNSRFPYQFVEVTGSGGTVSHEYIAYDTNTGDTFAYTSFGLQRISSRKADIVFPEASDFLAGQIFEDFNESTLEFTVQEIYGAFKKKIALISARYLVISYGITELTHALVVDLAMERWGKLKVTHTDCFEYVLLDQEVSDIPKKSIAFVTSTGTVYTVNSDQRSASRSGVIMFGKFQYVRSRLLALEEIVLESVYPGQTVECYNYASYDGKTLLPAELCTETLSASGIRKYAPHRVAYNHSILFKGAFTATTLELVFFPHGRM